ncbi:hypothetical protein, partial [Stenotrophomonas sp.]|uniref:hypothetical protein n=1 Tax=Stenotrophomonas sp. TaxID=69392 RepID=UPI002898CFD9
PGFFQNEDLAELAFEYRILFQGLWCEGDREGRLEDRPKRLKAAIFPYDNVDVDAGLSALAASGFIVRYEVDGKRYIQTLNFVKHQNPHKKEAASVIPGIPGGDRTASAGLQETPVEDPEIPGQAEEFPERARLIPDSPFLIPDSSVADATAPVVATPELVPVDPIWGSGLGFLLRKGIPEKQARSLLGKLRQSAGDVELGALLYRAESEDISDPAPWLMAAASRAKQRAGPGGRQPQQMGKTAQALMALEEFGNGGLDQAGNFGGPEAAHVLGPGAHPGSGGYPVDRSRLVGGRN